MKLVKWPQDQAGGHNYHWCPACEKLHVIPDETGKRWTRSGPDDAPSYTPSFLQYDVKRIGDIVWGNCHYILTNGMIHFQPDSWHKRNDVVPMPDVPDDVVTNLIDTIFGK